MLFWRPFNNMGFCSLDSRWWTMTIEPAYSIRRCSQLDPSIHGASLAQNVQTQFYGSRWRYGKRKEKGGLGLSGHDWFLIEFNVPPLGRTLPRNTHALSHSHLVVMWTPCTELKLLLLAPLEFCCHQPLAHNEGRLINLFLNFCPDLDSFLPLFCISLFL